MTYTYHYISPLGGITLAGSAQGLTGLWFDGQKYFGSTLGERRETKDIPVFTQTAQWLDIYFSGKEPSFTPPLSLNATPFRRAVWEILLSIPYGQTMTYKEIAGKIAEKTGFPPCPHRQWAAPSGITPSPLSSPVTGLSEQTGASPDMPGELTKKKSC